MEISNQKPATWRCGRFHFKWHQVDDFQESHPLPIVMGILNVTPDSFSDGGRYFSARKAIDHAHQMIEDGAKIIDIGGESSKPGAEKVSESEEQDRVMPIIEALKDSKVALSLDSYKTSTMTLAAKAGIDILNDISGFSSPGNQQVAVDNPSLGLCVMHMQNDPKTMQIRPSYDDVIREVNDFFLQRIKILESLGVSPERICLDPGIGFGKTPLHNLQLINQLGSFAHFGMTTLIGISRKSTLAKLIGSDIEDRTVASITAMLFSIERGAKVLRVHDVKESVQAIRVWTSLSNEII
jgi:dihydropteroate synthase